MSKITQQSALNDILQIRPFFKSVNGDEPILPSFEINARWRTVWLRAIARAWRDPVYREKLIGVPRDPGPNAPTAEKDRYARLQKEAAQAAAERKTRPSTRAALEEAGFDFLDFFEKLLFIEIEPYDGNHSYEPPPAGTDDNNSDPPNNGWKDFPAEGLRAKLVLKLPPSPKHQQDFAVALADYDAGGRVYPFTWC
jgi:hypothetical protein